MDSVLWIIYWNIIYIWNVLDTSGAIKDGNWKILDFWPWRLEWKIIELNGGFSSKPCDWLPEGYNRSMWGILLSTVSQFRGATRHLPGVFNPATGCFRFSHKHVHNTFIIGDVRQIDLVAASHAVGVPERSFLVGKSRSAGFIYTAISMWDLQHRPIPLGDI